MASSVSAVSLFGFVEEADADIDSGDVEEMEVHHQEIKEQKLLKLAFLGAKLGLDGHPWSS